MRTWLGFLFLVYTHAEDLQFRLLKPEPVLAQFARIALKNPEREAELRNQFSAAGCGPELTEVKASGSKLPNVVCRLPGATTRTIVVTAHFDNAGPGEGAIDNWSGAALLPSLYASMAGASHNLTFIFLGCTDEEKGLVGSRAWVSRLTKEQRAQIVANVNIDTVGFPGPVRVWGSRADPALLKLMAELANAMQIPVQGTNVDKVGDGDSHSFLDRKIPVIDFHSLSTETLPILHSTKDIRSALDADSYYETYRFLTAYLALLDLRLK